MLATRTMGSNGGHRSLPFGYDPNEIQGIGLPSFHIPGPPPGQPLLNDREHEEIDQFFTAFDNDNPAHHQDLVAHFPDGGGQFQGWNMPPTFVGSETSLRPAQHSDWQNAQMGSYQFGGGGGMPAMGQHVPPFDNDGHYPPFYGQHHTAPHTAQPISSNFVANWQPNYQAQQMGFGSDPNFRHNGYDGPSGPVEAEMGIWNSFEAHSTASNTQPNTRPSTQPSSPIMTKKRKLDEFSRDVTSNGHRPSLSQPSQRGNNKSSTSQHRKQPSFVKHEQPITPLSKPHTPQGNEVDADADADAEYDDDVAPDQNKSISPTAPWPSSKGKPTRTDKPSLSSKSARSRKKSVGESSASKTKSKASRSSPGSVTPISRIPLTAEQKKANHTNSEQRRRDATAKAYAELYDMVPEIAEMGKQSTMKRLEVVVDKVRSVKTRLELLRTRLHLDSVTGVPLMANTHVVAPSETGDPRRWPR